MTRRLGVLVGVALALVAASCSSGGGSDADPPTTTNPRSGVPTTTGPLGSGTSPIQDGVRIEVLSGQPDRVSGVEARVRVSPPTGGRVGDLRVSLGDTDVTAQLQAVDGALEGIVTGLIEGNNTLEATNGSDSVIQRLRAWPVTGPIFSGPHLPLLACSTEEHGLGAPTDDDCSASPKVTWRYVTTDGDLAELTSDERAPADLATASIDGQEVPLYVRHELGVINRSVYEIASIDATPTDDDPTGPGWSGKLLYRYGGGCGTTFGQGQSATEVLDPAFLRQGYVVATATFNTFGVQCNDVLSAETTMMVKERVIEAFGVPDFTIGEGASGGAIQLHLLAQNYPGLINGAVAMLPFPDAFSIAPGVTDCGLLLDYYRGAGAQLTDEQRQAINGHATSQTCQRWSDSFLATIDPTRGCDPKISQAQIYDPATNRGGIRCTLQDANRNQLGIDQATGFARRPLDNVGLQYGLEALNDSTISIDDFLNMNEAIGGYDIDGKITPDRSEAELDTVLHTYETGRISMGGGDQASIPIIDVNMYRDLSGDIHDRFRAFSLRDRLAWSGDPEQAPGFQVWTRGEANLDSEVALDAVAVVEEWLTALRSDDGGGNIRDVLRRTRPDEAADNCLLPGGTDPIRGDDVYDAGGRCHRAYPLAGDPRIAAGGPRSAQVLKCALKPIDPLDYEVRFSLEQEQRLREIFGGGVCDWNLPSEGQTAPASPDRSYEDVETPAQNA